MRGMGERVPSNDSVMALGTVTSWRLLALIRRNSVLVIRPVPAADGA